MRQVKAVTTLAGETRYRVRYRSANTETSETFRVLKDAQTFAAILGSGKADRVAEALGWLAAREEQATSQNFAHYFEDYLRHLTGITPRTRDDYEAMHRRYLTELDDMPLPLITRSHVADIVNRLDRQGLSPKTIKNVMHMLSSVMGAAVEEGHAVRNPVKRVRLPKASLKEEDVRFLTREEAAALVVATPEHYKPLVLFLLGTGLRWSEATALMARHVDLNAGTVAVRQAWKRIPGGWEIGTPKSRKARRTVNAAVPALVAVQPLLRKPNDYVFLTTGGSIVRHSNFYNRIWVPSCERAGLDPRPNIHACRHTHASWLISDGQSIEAVQDQLGHESLETTRKVYAHLLPAVGVAVGRAASLAMQDVLAQSAELDRRRDSLAIAVGD